MNFLKTTIAAAIFALAGIAAASPGSAHEIKVGNLVIHHPWSREVPDSSEVSAGFMEIHNTGTEDDTLISATAEISPMVQVHEMKMDGDVMKMSELKDGLVIPAGGEVVLKPGSFHIMFMGLTSHPVAESTFKGTLTFAKAGTVDITYMVQQKDAAEPEHN
jgi:copper(I)-binding protein